MDDFSPSMTQDRKLTSRLQSGVTGSFYPVSIQGRNSSFPMTALSKEPSSSSQPLTGSRDSSSILTVSLKPQLFPTRSQDMAAPGQCGGSKKLPESSAPLIFLLHIPSCCTSRHHIFEIPPHPFMASVLSHCSEPGHMVAPGCMGN